MLKNTTSPWFGELYAQYATKQPSRKSVLPKFADLLRDQDESYNEIQLEVFTESLAQDIGGPEEMFADDFVTKAQILTPAFEQVMLLGEAPVDLIVAHAEIATAYNRGEIAVEDLGAEMDKVSM